MKKTISGFTLVELLIVIVVLAIIAAVTVVAYNGITRRANESRATNELAQVQKYAQLYRVEHGTYPLDLSGANLDDEISYFATETTYCASAEYGNQAYAVQPSGSPSQGSCATNNTTNYALGATVTVPENARNSPLEYVTNGNTDSAQYFDGRYAGYVTVDLGNVKNLSRIVVWHYYANGRTYKNSKTEISSNGTSWTTVFDSSVSGTYAETAAGHTITFSPQQVRYIRDSINGSTSNSYNHWVEIEAY